MIILDSRLVFIGYETYLVPMLDFVNLKLHDQDKFQAKFDEQKIVNITAPVNYKKGEEVFINKQLNNDKLFIFHGIIPEENEHNCYSTSFTFSGRDDTLRSQRSKFFGKFFLYDSNMRDNM